MENKKILIIDDDIDLTRSYQEYLENKGFKVSVADDGETGIEEVRKFQPDLVILDVMMTTNLEGLKVAHEIKRNPELHDMPILVITGMTDAMGVNIREAFSDVKSLPGVYFLDKPVDLDELLVQVLKLTIDTSDIF